VHEEVDRAIRLWDKVLLCASEHSLKSWWVDNEITTAFDKEQRIMKDRGEKVRTLIPLDLDGFLFDGWKNGRKVQVLSRYVADFTDWKNDSDKFDSQVDRVIKALKLERAPPPEPKL